MDLKSDRVKAQAELNSIEAALRGDEEKAKPLLAKAKAAIVKYGAVIGLVVGFIIGRLV